MSILHYFSSLAQHIVKQVAIFGVCEKELCGSRDMRPFSCRFAIHREQRPSHQTEPSKTSLAQPYQLVWNIFSKHPKKSQISTSIFGGGWRGKFLEHVNVL